jgi:hypothetical protein
MCFCHIVTEGQSSSQLRLSPARALYMQYGVKGHPVNELNSGVRQLQMQWMLHMWGPGRPRAVILKFATTQHMSQQYHRGVRICDMVRLAI